MATSRPTAVLLAALAALVTTSCASQPDGPATASPAPAASAEPTAPAPSASPEPTAEPSAAPTAAPTAAGPTIAISGFEYAMPASVRPGEQVTVVNQDREAHTVTIDRGAVRLSVLPGATAVFAAPTEVGAHTVVCDFHGGMDAVLTVA